MNNESEFTDEYVLKLQDQLEEKTYLYNKLQTESKYVINKQKEIIDKIKEYCENKIEEQKCMPDFSKSYLENYDKVMEEQHLSHSGVMLETIKSTTTKRCEEILKLLEEIE